MMATHSYDYVAHGEMPSRPHHFLFAPLEAERWRITMTGIGSLAGEAVEGRALP